MVSLDERLIKAMDIYLNKLDESDIHYPATKSQLVDSAICCYFEQLGLKLTKGEKEDYES